MCSVLSSSDGLLRCCCVAVLSTFIFFLYFRFCCVIFFLSFCASACRVHVHTTKFFSLSLFSTLGYRIYGRKNGKKICSSPLLLPLLRPSLVSLSFVQRGGLKKKSSTCTTGRKWRELFVYCSYTTFLIVFNAHLKNENLILCFNEEKNDDDDDDDEERKNPCEVWCGVVRAYF